MFVLFLNNKSKKCGVYQYGIRLFNILKKSEKINYLYEEIETYEDYDNITKNVHLSAVFFNYHSHTTMNWLNNNNIKKNFLNIGLQHDLEEYNFFDVIVRLDTTLIEEIPKKYNIPRPIYEDIDVLLKDHICKTTTFHTFVNETLDNIPIFGSFGFPCHRKGFDKIIEFVNNNFDHAIIKFLLPYNNSTDFNYATSVINHIHSINRKPGIKLMITNEFVENEDILFFLKSNTMNIFMYDGSHPNSGVSSVIDYALSVKKPLAITDSHWFRHIYNDDICIYKNDIHCILKNSLTHVNKMCQLFSNENLINKVDGIIYYNLIQGIIPLGGNASRMNNLPKFLLPCKINSTLLDNTVDIFHKNGIFNIISGLSDNNYSILKNNNKFNKTILNTKTMAETVYHLVNNDNCKKNLLIMPDTYFSVKDEIIKMVNILDKNDIVVLLWKIKDYQIGKVGQCKVENGFVTDVIDKNINCDYEYFWGSIAWNSTMNKLINPTWETIGDLIKKAIELNIPVSCVISDGFYYDCGTYQEYFKMIKNET